MTDTQRNKRPARRPDCVTETRIGNTILVVSGFFKEGATDTAADKMRKVLEAEAAPGYLTCVSLIEKPSFLPTVKKQI